MKKNYEKNYELKNVKILRKFAKLLKKFVELLSKYANL